MSETKIWVIYFNNFPKRVMKRHKPGLPERFTYDWDAFTTIAEAKAFTDTLSGCDWVAIRGEPDLAAYEFDDAYRIWPEE